VEHYVFGLSFAYEPFECRKVIWAMHHGVLKNQCQSPTNEAPAGKLQLKPMSRLRVGLQNAGGPGFAICASAEAVTD